MKRYQNILAVCGHQMKVPNSGLFGLTRERSICEFSLFISAALNVSRQSSPTVCMQTRWSGTCNLSPRLKLVPGVCLLRYHLMKVTEAKNKTALKWAGKMCKWKVRDAETQTGFHMCWIAFTPQPQHFLEELSFTWHQILLICSYDISG